MLGQVVASFRFRTAEEKLTGLRLRESMRIAMKLDRHLNRADLPNERRNTVAGQLLLLQWAQLQHDELYHRDIVILPVGTRLKHMTLHMAKYLGYFAETSIAAGENQRITFERALIDTFVIALASANTLNFDLGRNLSPELSSAPTLADLGHRLLSIDQERYKGLPFLITFAARVGQLAKAAESLDHLESQPYREAFREGMWSLFELVVGRSADEGIDLDAMYRERMREVESRNLFNSFWSTR